MRFLTLTGWQNGCPLPLLTSDGRGCPTMSVSRVTHIRHKSSIIAQISAGNPPGISCYWWAPPTWIYSKVKVILITSLFLVELRSCVHELRRARLRHAAKFTEHIKNALKVCSDNNGWLQLLIKHTITNVNCSIEPFDLILVRGNGYQPITNSVTNDCGNLPSCALFWTS